MTATPTSATSLRPASRAEQVTPTPAGASAPSETRDDHPAGTPGAHWGHALAKAASTLGGIALELLVVSVVFLVLDLVTGTEPEGILLGDAWVEAGLLLALAVVLSAPKIVVRFVDRRRAGTPSSALDG